MSYTLIERRELTEAASSIFFENIPQFYTDLVVLVSGRGTRSGFDRDDFFIKFNSITSGYSARLLQGNGSTTAVAADSSQAQITRMSMPAATVTANTFGNATIYIPNYSGSTNKSVSIDSVTENNGTTAYQQIISGLMANTEAISSITIVPEVSTIAAGTTIFLYGINRKSGPGVNPKAIGGSISYANGYWIHTFFGSGSFIPFENMNVEYLVVAGGGGGGVAHGGGGAGGYRSSVIGEMSGGGALAESTLSLIASTNYSVTVGAGGSGRSAASRGLGTNGSSSTFHTIASIGGGGGGDADLAVATGGSGGGTGYILTAVPNNRTANQGYSGGAGTGNIAPYYPSGGGGGASASGQTPSSSSDNGGDGGAGIISSITGTPVGRAGGGAGGNYGNVSGGVAISGGGNAGTPTNKNGISGIANTGGGGGGSISSTTSSSDSGISGNGGSGVVIVRYRAS